MIHYFFYQENPDGSTTYYSSYASPYVMPNNIRIDYEAGFCLLWEFQPYAYFKIRIGNYVEY